MGSPPGRQASPTTMKGMRTKSTPRGNVEMPINPIALALVSGATYVARGFSGVPEHMASLIAGGIAHRGFSLIDVFSPCVTYNKLNTYPWFKERVYKLEDEARSEEHTSELQSRLHLVCRLLLEKKKNIHLFN